MTEKKTKPAVKVKVNKKKSKSPSNKVTDKVFRAVLTGNFQPNAERLATAQALITLRTIELHKNDELETMLWSAYRECREKVVKTILGAVLKNKLRLIDAQIIVEMIKNETAMISAWEYEHLDTADELISPFTNDSVPIKTTKTLELFKALGATPIDEEDDET
jgi:hypothetical protein